MLEQRAADAGMHGPHLPILLAMSDNGPQMTSGATTEFMAICAPSSITSARTITASVCTRPSATSPPTTSTRDAAPRSGRPAATSCNALTLSGLPPAEANVTLALHEAYGCGLAITREVTLSQTHVSGLRLTS